MSLAHIARKHLVRAVALALLAAAPATGAATADCPAGRVWYQQRCLSPEELTAAWTCPEGTTAEAKHVPGLALAVACKDGAGTPVRAMGWSLVDPWPLTSMELTAPSYGVVIGYHRHSDRPAERHTMAGEDGPGRLEHLDEQGRLTADVAMRGARQHGLTLHFAPDGRVTKVMCFAMDALQWTDEADPEGARTRPCPGPAPGAPTTAARPRQEAPQVLYAFESKSADLALRIALGRTDVFFTTTQYEAGGYVLAVPRAGGRARVILPREGEWDEALDVAVDDERVYWTERHGSGLMAAPLGGGAPTRLAPDRSTEETMEWPGPLALDATHVYWGALRSPRPTAGGELRRVPKAGGAPEVFVSRPAAPEALALDATHVYWTEPEAGRILRAPKAAGGAATPVTLVEGRRFLGPIAVDDTHLYWAERGERGVAGLVDVEGRVLRVPKAGGPPQELASLPGNAQSLVVAGGDLFIADVSQGSVLRLPKGGGRPSTIARDLGRPGPLAADDTHVYFADPNHDTIARVPRDNELPGPFGLP